MKLHRNSLLTAAAIVLVLYVVCLIVYQVGTRMLG